jgi:hypothetical protein
MQCISGQRRLTRHAQSQAVETWRLLLVELRNVATSPSAQQQRGRKLLPGPSAFVIHLPLLLPVDGALD